MPKRLPPTPEVLTDMEIKLREIAQLQRAARLLQGIAKLAIDNHMTATQIIDSITAEVDIIIGSMTELIEEVSYMVQKYKQNPPVIH